MAVRTRPSSASTSGIRCTMPCWKSMTSRAVRFGSRAGVGVLMCSPWSWGCLLVLAVPAVPGVRGEVGRREPLEQVDRPVEVVPFGRPDQGVDRPGQVRLLRGTHRGDQLPAGLARRDQRLAAVAGVALGVDQPGRLQYREV